MFDATIFSKEIKDRLEQHFKLWEESFDNRVRIRHTHVSEARKILQDLGLKDFDDFQVRQGQVRFVNRDDMALAMVSGLGDLLEDKDV